MDFADNNHLENIITSKGRFKILKLLAEARELNITEISRKTHLAYLSTDHHLKILKRAGLVQEKNLGRIRLFRFREEDERCRVLKQFFDGLFDVLHSR